MLRKILKITGVAVIIIVILGAIGFSFPIILKSLLQQKQLKTQQAMIDQFPVTVNPKAKIIVENAEVNNFLGGANSPLQAAVGNRIWNTFEWLATAIAELPLYKSIAAVDGGFVTLTPGLRKEQVANSFSQALAWSSIDEQNFMTPEKGAALPLAEGSFTPGLYFVSKGTTPAQAQNLVNNRFSEEVLSHYGTSTAEIVPLNDTLTIASLIQRETNGDDDMRLISGIIWNRIFKNMNLQLDATLQYAKANKTSTKVWWPNVVPADKFQKSAFNTYIHPGLPPSPIANPSVAAILAALNPVQTSCLFYFHDKNGAIHCNDTYEKHVASLKLYYGQGK